MRALLRKAGAGFVVAAIALLGGGFASADTKSGDTSANTTVDITYQIASFRAIELSSSSAVDFGILRQGGTATKSGPTVYYATSWSGDQLSAYLNLDMENAVVLKLTMGSVARPDNNDMTCDAAGTAQTQVTMSSLHSYVIGAIADCGAPNADSASDVDTDPDHLDWASATTSFALDATNAVDNGNLSSAVTKIVYFVLDGGWGI